MSVRLWCGTHWRGEQPDTCAACRNADRAPNKHRPNCPTHGDVAQRNDQWDAYYCPTCPAWLEKQCGDAKCQFCVGRPEKPPQETP